MANTEEQREAQTKPSLKPLSMKQLFSIIIDTVAMFGRVLVLFMFVIHNLGVVGDHLWAGELRNRTFLGEDIVTMYNSFLSPYCDYVPGERASFICSRHRSTYREDGNVCTLAAPHQDKPGNWGVTAGPSDGDWNLYYNVCRPDGPNFDNIVHAWVTVLQLASFNLINIETVVKLIFAFYVSKAIKEKKKVYC